MVQVDWSRFTDSQLIQALGNPLDEHRFTLYPTDRQQRIFPSIVNRFSPRFVLDFVRLNPDFYAGLTPNGKRYLNGLAAHTKAKSVKKPEPTVGELVSDIISGNLSFEELNQHQMDAVYNKLPPLMLYRMWPQLPPALQAKYLPPMH